MFPPLNFFFYQRRLSPDFHIVLGNFDDNIETAPETKTIRIGDFVIGLIHGHQIVPWGDALALDAIRQQLGCDILISGHTHHHEVSKRKLKLKIPRRCCLVRGYGGLLWWVLATWK